jgi:hypothetical protein
MRALTMDELIFVSGGSAPTEEIVVTGPRLEQLGSYFGNPPFKPIFNIGFSADSELTYAGIPPGLDGDYQEIVFRLQPPGVSGAVRGALSAIGSALIAGYRDGKITPEEWTKTLVAGLIGAAIGALGISVDATLTSQTASIVWGIGVSLSAGIVGGLINS